MTAQIFPGIKIAELYSKKEVSKGVNHGPIRKNNSY